MKPRFDGIEFGSRVPAIDPQVQAARRASAFPALRMCPFENRSEGFGENLTMCLTSKERRCAEAGKRPCIRP